MVTVHTSDGHLAADTGGVLPVSPSGSWQLQSSSVTKGTVLAVENKFVELSATASWMYIAS